MYTSFGPRAVAFAVDRADDRSIVMTCVREQDNPNWLGTELSITLTPLAGGKTRVDLAHAGYASKNECYARCIDGWDHFLSSLARYATTGEGMPFGATVAAPAPAQTSAEWRRERTGRARAAEGCAAHSSRRGRRLE